MINFKKIILRNFMSYGNDGVEIDYTKAKTTIVVGKNGSGKSTPFLDALTFVLYNKPYRNINKPKLVSSINKGDLEVAIEFETNGATYNIIRGIKPNIFQIYRNGQLLNPPADTRDYQAILENQILKMSYKTFCQVVVLGSSTYVPFMELTPQQRREVNEDLLDLETFSIMNSILKEKHQHLQNELKEIQTNQRILIEKMKLIEQNEKSSQENHDNFIQELNNQLESIKKSIVNTFQEIKYNDTKIEELEKTNSFDIEYIKNSIKTRNNKITILENKIQNLKSGIDFFDNNEHCPKCLQEIPHEHRQDILLNEQKDLHDTTITLNEIQEERNSLQKIIQDFETIQASLSDYRNKNAILKATILSSKKTYQEISKKIEKLNNEFEDQKKYSDKNIILEEMKEIENRKEILEEEKMIQQYSLNILKDTGIKSKIIKQYIPIVNSMINRYLNAMNFPVLFEIDENFNETIKSRHRDDFQYNSFSEGEKSRINLAILFAWRQVAKMRNACATNLLILDEILDSALDNSGAEDFVRILNEFDDSSINSFVISHKTDTISDSFERVLRVEKVNNFSTIRED